MNQLELTQCFRKILERKTFRSQIVRMQRQHSSVKIFTQWKDKMNVMKFCFLDSVTELLGYVINNLLLITNNQLVFTLEFIAFLQSGTDQRGLEMSLSPKCFLSIQKCTECLSSRSTSITFLFIEVSFWKFVQLNARTIRNKQHLYIFYFTSEYYFNK